eukprot:2954815-Rhodomonas_salina.2
MFKTLKVICFPTGRALEAKKNVRGCQSDGAAQAASRHTESGGKRGANYILLNSAWNIIKTSSRFRLIHSWGTFDSDGVTGVTAERTPLLKFSVFRHMTSRYS